MLKTYANSKEDEAVRQLLMFQNSKFVTLNKHSFLLERRIMINDNFWLTKNAIISDERVKKCETIAAFGVLNWWNNCDKYTLG
jgi:hypothetical protein